MADVESCPICGKKIGNGLFSVSAAMTDQIKFFGKRGVDAAGWCQKCMDARVNEEKKQLTDEITKVSGELSKNIQAALESIELLTTPPPASWTGEFKGIVSGHAVIGTGPLTEIVSAWTDFFGEKSHAYQGKIRDGEQGAILDAKFACMEKGANKIVGCNISLQEATSGHGMLMISCVGTAYLTHDAPESFMKTTELLNRKKEMAALWEELKKAGSF